MFTLFGIMIEHYVYFTLDSGFVMDILDKDFSRRDFMKLGLGAFAFGTVAGMMPSSLALASSGGTSSGDAHGGGDDTGSWEAAGTAFVWFDAGGFYGYGEPVFRKAPKQGWDGDSIETFIDLMDKRMSEIRGKNMVLEDYVRAAYNMTDRQYIRKVCNDALALARTRAQNRVNELNSLHPDWNLRYSGKARIVGVGWTYCAGHKNADGGWSFPHGGNGWAIVTAWSQTYTSIMKRKGNISTYDTTGTAQNVYATGSHEFLKAAGWSEASGVKGYENDSWCDMIYNMGKKENTGDGLVFIAHAVADSEMSGLLTVKKVVVGSNTGRKFDFTVKFTMGSETVTRTFSLAHGETKVFDGLPYGTKYSVTEDSDYEVTWVNRTGTISAKNINAICTCTNTSGFLQLEKDVTD